MKVNQLHKQELHDKDMKMHKDTFRICWLLAILCYVVSFVMPVYNEVGDNALHWGQGVTMFFMGWLTILLGFTWSCISQFLVWMANPIFLRLLIAVTQRYNNNKEFLPTRGEILRAIVCVILGALFLVGGGIISDEGGGFHTISTYHIGYWLWWGAMVLFLVALLLKARSKM